MQDVYTSFADTSAYSEQTHTRMLVEDTYPDLARRRALPVAGRLYGSVTQEHSPSVFLAQHAFAPDVPVYSDNRYDRIAELAAYGEASLEFTDALMASIGGRAFDIHTRTTSQVQLRALPRPQHRRATSTITGFSPKASHPAVLPPRRPGLCGLSRRASGPAASIPAARCRCRRRCVIFAPDQLRNIEGGLKLQACDGRLAVNSALFYDTWKDIQTDQFRASGIPFTTNVGDADILGLETEVGYNWGNGLSGAVQRPRWRTPGSPTPTSPSSQAR